MERGKDTGITAGLARLEQAQQNARVIGEARLIQRLSHLNKNGSTRSPLEVDWGRPRLTNAEEVAATRSQKRQAGIRYLGQ